MVQPNKRSEVPTGGRVVVGGWSAPEYTPIPDFDPSQSPHPGPTLGPDLTPRLNHDPFSRLSSWRSGALPPITARNSAEDSSPTPPIKAVIPDSDCAPRVLSQRPAPHTLALASVAWEWYPWVMDRSFSPVCSDHELCISKRAASTAEALPPLPPNLPPS